MSQLRLPVTSCRDLLDDCPVKLGVYGQEEFYISKAKDRLIEYIGDQDYMCAPNENEEGIAHYEIAGLRPIKFYSLTYRDRTTTLISALMPHNLAL